MWKKIAIASTVGAAVLGSGAAALAESGSGGLLPASTASPLVSASSAPTSSATGAAGKGRTLRLRHFEHGEWVSRDAGKNVTHDAIAGQVAAVSSTSITVKAADGVSMTFAVNGSTKVRVNKAVGSIAAVKDNDRVLVSGTRSGTTDTAVRVVDAGPPK